MRNHRALDGRRWRREALWPSGPELRRRPGGRRDGGAGARRGLGVRRAAVGCLGGGRGGVGVDQTALADVMEDPRQVRRCRGFGERPTLLSLLPVRVAGVDESGLDGPTQTD